MTIEHVCTVCHVPADYHPGRCICGDLHWPALCCRGCDCGSWEAEHGEDACETCGGSGAHPLEDKPTMKECPKCHGTGRA